MAAGLWENAAGSNTSNSNQFWKYAAQNWLHGICSDESVSLVFKFASFYVFV